MEKVAIELTHLKRHKERAIDADRVVVSEARERAGCYWSPVVPKGATCRKAFGPDLRIGYGLQQKTVQELRVVVEVDTVYDFVNSVLKRSFLHHRLIEHCIVEEERGNTLFFLEAQQCLSA